MITFAFKNAEIIELLRQRGEIIKEERWDDMEEIDKKINKHKNEHFLDLMTPCSVFITFQCEEGVNRAMEFNKTVDSDERYAHLNKWLGNHSIEVESASEPSDIIWENRHFTPAQRLKKKLIVFLVICLLLLCSFRVIFLCSSISLEMLELYPDVECASLPID
jgi:hypothetical protein